jgi:hypothetical protein
MYHCGRLARYLLFGSLALQSGPEWITAQESVYQGAFAGGNGGLSNDLAGVRDFETNSGKGLAIVNFFKNWDDSNGPLHFPTTAMDDIRAHGSIPLLSWQPEGASPDAAYALTNIIRGDFDSFIRDWAEDARAWGNPFFLRFAHEMNGTWYPWCANVNGNTAADYIAAWRHVHDLFLNVGATNVTWVWCVNTKYSGSASITALYPGDGYVDWISLDSYNRLSNAWADFSSRSQATLDELMSVASGKPILVAETGCHEDAVNDKGQWFRNAMKSYLKSSMPRIKAWVYFNGNNPDGNDWRITTSSNSLAGYQDSVQLSYYSSNTFAALSNCPIQPLLNDGTSADTMAPFVSLVKPGCGIVQTNARVEFRALAADKTGITRVEFATNGVLARTENLEPYQYFWTAPAVTGQSLTITATAYDDAGNTATSTLEVLSAAAPAPPGSVAATDGSYTDKVRVTWTGVSAAFGYEVWRNSTNDSATASRLTPSPLAGTTYDDTTADYTTNYYWVRALNTGTASGFGGPDPGYRVLPPVTLTNSDVAGSTSFDAAGNWDSGLAPEPGRSYWVGSGYTLRTPTNQALPAVFAGGSLTLAGTLGLKMTNLVTVADLRLTNGLVQNYFAGGNPNQGRLGGNITVITNGTLDAGGNAGAVTSLRILASIGGSGALTVRSPSTVTLAASNTWRGPLTLLGTTLELDSTAALTPSSLVLQNYTSSALTNSAVTNIVRAGGALNVGGGPGDVLRVGYRTTAGTSCLAVLNVAAQPSFTVNVGEFSVGINQYNDSFSTLGYVYLATNNFVTATNVLIANSGFNPGGTSILLLGSGSNYFSTPSLTVGALKENALLTLPGGGVFRLENGPGRASLTVGGQNGSTGASPASTNDLGRGTFLGRLENLVIGQKTGGGSGGVTGVMLLGNSPATDVNANSVLVGSLAGAAGGSSVALGILSFGGGSFLVNSNLTLAGFDNGNGSAAGSLNISGGSFEVGGDIVDGGGQSTVNLGGGRLDLKPAGDPAPGSLTADTLVLNGLLTNVLNVTITNLSGSGVIAAQSGTTTVLGWLTPGGSNSLGTLSGGSFVLAGATIMELSRGQVPNADRLKAGSVKCGGVLTVTNLGAALQAGDAFQLFEGSIQGAFSATNLPALTSTNLHWDFSQFGAQGMLRVAAAAAPAPSILPPVLAGTNFTFQANSQPGFSYVLEGATGLAPANWTALQTNGGGTLLSYSIPISPDHPRRYFRLRAQ